MFANIKFTLRKAPAFRDSSRFETEPRTVTCLKPYIFDDEDSPPKTLIAFDIYDVPADDIETGVYKKGGYDMLACVALVPEDAIRLMRHLNKLISAVFDDDNYIRK